MKDNPARNTQESVLSIETEKFTDNLLLLYRYLDGETAGNPAFHILLYMLRGSNAVTERKDAFRMELMRLYDARIGWSYLVYGTKLFFYMQASWIRESLIRDDRYVERLKKIILDSFDHPNLSRENFEEARLLYVNSLRSRQDHPAALATEQAIQQIRQDHPLKAHRIPSIEETERVTYQEVIDLWKEIEKLPVHGAWAGKPEEAILEILEKDSGNLERGEKLVLLETEEPVFSRKTKDISQASLIQIYSTSTSPGDPDYAGLILGNALLGKSQNSLLFEEIREKNSLCYGISSNIISLDGAMTVRAEILPEGIDRACDIIAEQVRRVREGDYDDALLERAKRDLVSQIRLRKDSMSGLLEDKIRRNYTNLPVVGEDFVERIRSMTREDIARGFEKVALISQALIVPEETDATDN